MRLSMKKDIKLYSYAIVIYSLLHSAQLLSMNTYNVVTNIYHKEENKKQLDVKFKYMFTAPNESIWCEEYDEMVIISGNLPIKIQDINRPNNDKYFIAAGVDKRGIIWSIDRKSTNQDRILSQILSGHKHDITSLDYSPDGKRLATGSADKTAKIWDINIKQKSNSSLYDWYLYYFGDASSLTLAGHSDSINSIAFSPCGKFVVTGSSDNDAMIWDVNPDSNDYGTCIQTLSDHYVGSIFAVAYSPDGQYIVTGSDDTTVMLWSADPKSENFGQRIKILWDHTDSVHTVALSPCGKFLATGSSDNTTMIWNLNQESNNYGLCMHTFIAHTEKVVLVAFTSDGKQLITKFADQTVAFLELKEHDNFIKEETNWKKEKIRKTDKLSDLTINYL